MLNALMGAIGEVDLGNRSRAIKRGEWFRLTLITSTVSASNDELAVRLQAMADTNPALISPGAQVAVSGSDRLTLAGTVSMNWDHVGDFIDSLLQVVYASIPAEMLKFEADIFIEPIADPQYGQDPKTGPTPVIGPPSTGGGPAPTPTPQPQPTAGSPTLFGVPVLYLAIGAGVLFFMSKGK